MILIFCYILSYVTLFLLLVRKLKQLRNIAKAIFGNVDHEELQKLPQTIL